MVPGVHPTTQQPQYHVIQTPCQHAETKTYPVRDSLTTIMNVYMPFLAVFNDFFYDFDGFFKYVDFSYDNFPYYRCRQYSEAEMDRSTHPGSAEVVIKPIIAPSQSRVGDDGDGDGRIFSEHPSPILHAPKDIISRKGKSRTPIYIYIYIYIYIHHSIATGLGEADVAGGPRGR